MSLLGIDVGTTGCKAVLFAEDGRALATAYEEYDWARPAPGWAELDAAEVWEKIKRVIRDAVAPGRRRGADPMRALSVSSLGEAVVPVTAERGGPRALDPELRRARRRVPGRPGPRAARRAAVPDQRQHAGQPLRADQAAVDPEAPPDLYERADKFLLWGGFVGFMLGAEPVVDYSLANRTLLFDLARRRLVGRAAGRDGHRAREAAAHGALGDADRDAGAARGARAGAAGGRHHRGRRARPVRQRGRLRRDRRGPRGLRHGHLSSASRPSSARSAPRPR